MALSKEQTEFFQTTLDMTRKQIGELNGQIEDELSKVKERLAELQNAKNAAKQIYDERLPRSWASRTTSTKRRTPRRTDLGLVPP